jgi:hypothetical protein
MFCVAVWINADSILDRALLALAVRAAMVIGCGPIGA